MTTATGGFLPAFDGQDGADGILHDFLSGITGIPGNRVVAAFQSPKPIIYDNSVDWLAYWIASAIPDQNPRIGTDGITRNIKYAVNIYAYGPNSREYMLAVINGCQVRQNNDGLAEAGYIFQTVDTGAVQGNELINNQWYKRFTATLVFGRHL